MDASFPVATLKWPELPRGPNYHVARITPPYLIEFQEEDWSGSEANACARNTDCDIICIAVSNPRSVLIILA